MLLPVGDVRRKKGVEEFNEQRTRGRRVNITKEMKKRESLFGVHDDVYFPDALIYHRYTIIQQLAIGCVVKDRETQTARYIYVLILLEYFHTVNENTVSFLLFLK